MKNYYLSTGMRKQDLMLSKINLFENQLWFDLLKPDESLNNLKILKLKPFQTVWISNKKD